MNIKSILIFLILILASTSTASAIDTWESYPSIVSGLANLRDEATPTVYNDDGTWYLIYGESWGWFYGYYWDDDTWVSDSTLVYGLSNGGWASSPTVYYDDGIWKLISGRLTGSLRGWYWDGDSWVLDSSVVGGITSVDVVEPVGIFNDSGTLKMVIGEPDATFSGYYWDGSIWVSDPSIKSGLTSGSYPAGKDARVSFFVIDGDWYSIVGKDPGDHYGFYWSGSTWIRDDSYVSGLGDIGWTSSPATFNDDGTWKVISANGDGKFFGWAWGEEFTLSGTVTNESGYVNNALITLSGLGNSATSNEIGYYEITNAFAITHTMTATETLHYDYTDSVTITGNTEENIFLTVIPIATPTPPPPVVAPPPVVPIAPTEEPTPFEEIIREETIIEETMIEIENLIPEEIIAYFEKVITYVGTGISWSFLLAPYLGAFVSHLLLKGKEEEENLFDLLLFGTIGWVLLLLINTLPYITIVTPSFALNSLIFGIAGFVVYTLLDIVSSNE